ncbi:MAG: hypothetical protein Q8P18_02410 [Pseudomonadota bacterium]|nr:hypothetical protein [Pseudomonadota bacterium]
MIEPVPRVLALRGVAVLALAASDLRPEVGEPVRLFASWAGGWPAEVGWRGVDDDLGLEARVTPRSPGPLEVSAGGVSIILDVQPAGDNGTVLVRPEVRSLPTIEAGSCRDDRFPTLAGPWVVWCSTTGRVDRAYNLGSLEAVTLSASAEAPGIGPGAILVPQLGLWRLPDASPVPNQGRVAGATVGPPATDGEHGVFAWAGHVEAFPLSERIRERTDAAPLPWYPAALAWPWAAWVEDGGLTGEDVWTRTAEGERSPLARSARSERHVVGDGRWLAWLDEEGVYVQDMARGERRVYAADTGFAHGLGLWGPVACWEDRGALRAGTGDIDVRCSDGVELHRPGHQRAPARWGPWLLFREGVQLLVATVPELVLDDDDPRAQGVGRTLPGGWRGAHREGLVTWTLDWPVEGWVMDRWDGAAWVPDGPVGIGRITLSHPGGDAVRLRPSS